MSLEALLPFGLSAADAIVLMAAVSAGLVVLASWSALLHRDPTAARLKGLARRRDALVANLKAADQSEARRRLLSPQGINRLARALRVKRHQRTTEIAEKLARAGWRAPEMVTAYVLARLILPVAFGAAGAVLFLGLGLLDLSPPLRLLATVGSAGLGYLAPGIYVSNQATKRREAIRKALPDALDLMVICTEAGLSLDAALRRAAGELRRNAPAIADELELTAIELGFLPERRRALANLTRRTDLPAVKSVVNALLQTEKYGTPLAQSLRVLAADYRSERLLKAEEKASRLPAVMTVPLILFVLPPLFVVLLGPGILRIIDGLRGIH